MTERGDESAGGSTAGEQAPTREGSAGAPPAGRVLSPASGGPARVPVADRG
ncbi:hypothetical protein OG896_17685 [Streptomyces sp. NBC_00669]|uniref:hypothetical protein n=1 Tax=Streptomyces sp. NBC_00669 TaxID=2976011 RepID=UPI002E306682|nr:hypothetical protein [Streptomyces sp. NBC_00669]